MSIYLFRKLHILQRLQLLFPYEAYFNRSLFGNAPRLWWSLIFIYSPFCVSLMMLASAVLQFSFLLKLCFQTHSLFIFLLFFTVNRINWWGKAAGNQGFGHSRHCCTCRWWLAEACPTSSWRQQRRSRLQARNTDAEGDSEARGKRRTANGVCSHTVARDGRQSYLGSTLGDSAWVWPWSHRW